METQDWLALRDRVEQAKDTDRRRGDGQATADLITELVAEFDLRTIDGVPVRPQMRVVDYDMRWTTVTGIQSIEVNGTVWFKTANGGMFDAKRLWAKMPGGC